MCLKVFLHKLLPLTHRTSLMGVFALQKRRSGRQVKRRKYNEDLDFKVVDDDGETIAVLGAGRTSALSASTLAWQAEVRPFGWVLALAGQSFLSYMTEFFRGSLLKHTLDHFNCCF